MKQVLRSIVLVPTAFLLGVLLLPAFLVTDISLFSQLVESIVSGNQKS